MLSLSRASLRPLALIAAALAGSSAHAIIGGSTDALGLSPYQYMGTMANGFSGTPIASNWFVTAAHVAGSVVGTNYTNPDGTFAITNVVYVPNYANDPNGLMGSTDIALVQISGTFSHVYRYGQVSTSPATGVNGTLATLVGIGGYSSAIGVAPGGNARAYATNTVDALAVGSFDGVNTFASYLYDLDDGTAAHNDTGSQFGTTKEGGIAGGDSGGGWFVDIGGALPMIIATSSGVGSQANFNDQPGGNFYDAGGFGIGGDLGYYASFIQQTTGVGPYVANPTPEPATFAALGFGALAVLRRRRRA